MEQADCSDDTLERDGRRLRFKLASAKEFATPCGPLVVTRRLFQADHGGLRPPSAMRGPPDETGTLIDAHPR